MKLVILDRDGVINHDSDQYIKSPEEWKPIPGSLAAIARLNQAGYRVVVASNQSGVARGFFDLAAVEAVHAAMAADLAALGAWIDAIEICPFLPDATVAAFAHPDHPDRKPNPGMMLRLIERLGLDPARTVVIGDKESDLEAARRAGVTGALFAGGDLDAFVLALRGSAAYRTAP